MEEGIDRTILHGWDMEVRDNFYEALTEQTETEGGSNIRPLLQDEDGEAILDETLLQDPSVQGLLEVILAAKAKEIADTSMPELGEPVSTSTYGYTNRSGAGGRVSPVGKEGSSKSRCCNHNESTPPSGIGVRFRVGFFST